MSALPHSQWPYLQTIVRVTLALAIGLFIGLERERRGKEAGMRTFAFAGLMGGLGGLLGEPYALLTFAMLGVLVSFLNVETMRNGEGIELTTSAALLVTGLAGILCGQGHTLTPAAVAVIAAALLAWKRTLAGFSVDLSETELRSAILLGILAFVIYPGLPTGSIDRWGAIEPRAAWITVILIAGIGFANYILWKIYGARGVELAGFLGGLVNSSVTVSELAVRVKETQGSLTPVAIRSILLATVAMLVRNGVLLAILAPAVLLASLLPHLMMLAGCALLYWRAPRRPAQAHENAPLLKLSSPFSLAAALKFGLFFLLLQVAGVLAQVNLGQLGVYAISFLGGLFSSSSAVAAAAALAVKGSVSPSVAAASAVLASLASVLVNFPLVVRAGQRSFTIRMAWSLGLVVALGVLGILLQAWFIVPGM